MQNWPLVLKLYYKSNFCCFMTKFIESAQLSRLNTQIFFQQVHSNKLKTWLSTWKNVIWKNTVLPNKQYFFIDYGIVRVQTSKKVYLQSWCNFDALKDWRHHCFFVKLCLSVTLNYKLQSHEIGLFERFFL